MTELPNAMSFLAIRNRIAFLFAKIMHPFGFAFVDDDDEDEDEDERVGIDALVGLAAVSMQQARR